MNLNFSQHLADYQFSCDYRSAKFDAKFFNVFARWYILFYFSSEKFRTSVNGKIK